MLARYAERRGYKTKVLSSSPNKAGGYKEVTFGIKGDGAYSVFKWEGAPTEFSACPRPSRRAASTRRRPRSR